MDLVLAGLNHETASIEVREKLAFSEEQARGFLGSERGNGSAPELLLLSTCNRTELYGRISPGGYGSSRGAAARMRELLLRGRNVDVDPAHFYFLTGIDAVRHLFKVAAGLDSMVMGESQILGQIKEAYRLACACRTNGFLINRLMHTAFRVGGRARSETKICAGAVSVSMAAVESSQKIFSELGARQALIIGAGEMATLTAEHFAAKKIGRLTFTNRTMSKAEEMAARFGGNTAPWDNLFDAIASADIVIASTRSQDYLITSDMVRAAMHARRNRPMFLADIAVPRNIEPSAAKLYNVFTHNIDDLKQIIDRNLTRRRAEVPKVESIIEEEMKKFMAWHSAHAAAPTIKALLGRAEEIRRKELERVKNSFSEEQRKELDMITRSFMNKILHLPIMKIREYAENSEMSQQRIDALRDIFDLKNDENENESAQPAPRVCTGPDGIL